MKGRILVMAASRDRPESLRSMVRSVKDTSTNADIAVYIDEDQREEYAGIDGALFVTGPRIGPCKSLNMLYSTYPDYDAYGAATDDCAFETSGWDLWVLSQVPKFRNRIGVIAPYLHGQIRRMDFPWATAEWIRAVGFFAYPRLRHFYWDVIMEMMGEDRCTVHATEKEFAIDHPSHPSSNLADFACADAYEFASWCALFRRRAISDLDEAIYEKILR